MEELLFSYGTLQRDKVQLDLFGRLLHGTADVLAGYRLSPIEIADELFLSKGDGRYQQIAVRSNNRADAIEGMVFAVSGNELRDADTYEPRDYKRIRVTLESGKQAWVYAAG